jgi:hypothetical protein
MPTALHVRRSAVSAAAVLDAVNPDGDILAIGNTSPLTGRFARGYWRINGHERGDLL